MTAYDMLTLLLGNAVEDVETNAAGDVTSILLRIRCRGKVKLFDSVIEPKHNAVKRKPKRRK